MNQPHYHICTIRLDAVGGIPGTVRRLNPDGYFIQPMFNHAGDQVLFWGHEKDEVGFNIWRCDLASNTLTKLTNDRAVTGHPFWTADSRRIVYFSTLGFPGETDWIMEIEFQSDRSPRNLWIMDPDGTNRQQLTTGAFIDECLCISPDAKRTMLAFSTVDPIPRST